MQFYRNMSVYYTLFYLIIAICFWSKSHVRATYVVNTAQYLENKKCVMRLDVEGHGVDGALYTSCEVGRKLNIRAEDGRLKIGDRNDPVSAFSDNTGSLVVLDEAGRIKKTFGSTNYDMYKYYQGMPNKKPFVNQRTFTDWIRVAFSPKKTASPSIKKPLHVDVIVVKSESLSFLTNTCMGKINVGGNGIKYEERMTCHQVQDRRVVFSPEGVILHDYRGAIQSVIVSQESVVTVNQDGSCNRMTSTNKDSQREKMVLMDIPSCSRTKAFVDQYLGVRVYRSEINFKEDILIRGRGLDHTLEGLPFTQAITIRIKYLAKDGVLLVGNYRENLLSAFSDTPGTLVVLQGRFNARNCTSHTYKEGEPVSSEMMDDQDCAKIKVRFNNAWNTINYEEKGSFYQFYVKRMSTKKDIINGDGSTRTEPYQSVKVEGGGIRYELYEAETSTDRLELHTTPSGLVLCDYEKQERCMVAEVINMMVIEKEECFKVTYDNFNYNKRVVDRATCDAVKGKVTFYRNLKL